MSNPCAVLFWLLVAVIAIGIFLERKATPPQAVDLRMYDYIVVGAGPGGCATAETLAESGKLVLLLERGPTRKENILTESKSGWPDVINSPAAQPWQTESCVWTVTAKSMGGATSLNGGAYLREKEEFWNNYKELFDFSEIERGYSWVEERLPAPLPLSEYGAARIQACLEAGYTPQHGYELTNPIGTQQLYATFVKQGDDFHRRAADELLTDRKNLNVTTHATVTKILFETNPLTGNPKATCVLFQQEGQTGESKACVKPDGEIVLSAGAIWSPFLAMTSGLGPKEVLHKYHIPVLKDLPLIGQNLHDKPVINLLTFFPASVKERPFTAIETGCTDDAGFFLEQTSGGNISTVFGLSTLALVPPKFRTLELRAIVQKSLEIPVIKKWLDNTAQFLAPLARPKSRGVLSIKSSGSWRNPVLVPKIDFRYFSDPDGADLKLAREYLRKILHVVQQDALRPWVAREADTVEDFFVDEIDSFFTHLLNKSFSPFNLKGPYVKGQPRVLPVVPADIDDDAAVNLWLKIYHASSYHIAGTMEMGKVVDPQFRLIGVDNLRVVDASILPQITEVNPQGTIEMLGRYAGLRIRSSQSASAAASTAAAAPETTKPKDEL